MIHSPLGSARTVGKSVIPGAKSPAEGGTENLIDGVKCDRGYRSADQKSVSPGGMADLPNNLLFVLKHFGTGVIISTAFIHLLMHAFVMFAK